MTDQASIFPTDVADALTQRRPLLWLNRNWRRIREVHSASRVGLQDVRDAQARLSDFAPALVRLFPELAQTGGIIESPLRAANSFKARIMGDRGGAGSWWIKADHELPVAGSVKARGGIYEVLLHAESIAARAGLKGHGDASDALVSTAARELFGSKEITVGSTGNLGMSIGIIAAALGFHASVHMSSDAKEWKKARLRARGVRVVEHEGDYALAVAQARSEARSNDNVYFVDDENSQRLFLGYSVAALRLQQQLQEASIVVGPKDPLFVYLPCGVGGAPGGITFGLRHVFGDDAHCFFAEPVSSPCMLMRLASGEDRPISVQELGLDNRTEADGLAVGAASELVVSLIRDLVSGVFTVDDGALFADLYALEQSEGLRIEPSSAAGARGAKWLLESDAGHRYLGDHDLRRHMDRATHVIWMTGGALVPDYEYRTFHERGEREWLAKNGR